MDRQTSKSNFSTGMLIGAGSAVIFAASFLFSMFYLAT
jgi:hypothetical protein